MYLPELSQKLTGYIYTHKKRMSQAIVDYGCFGKMLRTSTTLVCCRFQAVTEQHEGSREKEQLTFTEHLTLCQSWF